MFVMDCYGHKLYNGVLIAHHLILDVPGGSSHLGYRRRVAICNNPPTRVKGVYNHPVLYVLGGSAIAYTKTDRTRLLGGYRVQLGYLSGSEIKQFDLQDV